MKKRNIPQHILLFVGLFLTLCLAACKHEPIEPLPSEPQPIEYTPEVPEPITNDFTLLKACIGKSQAEVLPCWPNMVSPPGRTTNFQKRRTASPRRCTAIPSAMLKWWCITVSSPSRDRFSHNG
ncbi:MAG: hypothetical protein J6X51_01715 [Bacteroidales bacterium]|nr:hypothetical protein [Bacteroidales bacterium]